MLDLDCIPWFVPVSSRPLFHNGRKYLFTEKPEVSLSVTRFALPFLSSFLSVDTVPLCRLIISSGPASQLSIPGSLFGEVTSGSGDGNQEHYLGDVALVPGAPVWSFLILAEDHLLVEFLQVEPLLIEHDSVIE